VDTILAAAGDEMIQAVFISGPIDKQFQMLEHQYTHHRVAIFPLQSLPQLSGFVPPDAGPKFDTFTYRCVGAVQTRTASEEIAVYAPEGYDPRRAELEALVAIGKAGLEFLNATS
jgi:hypothetical protein